MNLKEQYKRLMKEKKMKNKEALDNLYEMIIDTFDFVAE